MTTQKTKQDPKIRTFIIENVDHYPQNLVRWVVQQLGVPRATVNRYVNRLVKEGILEAKGATRARTYSLRDFESKSFHFDLGKDLAEDVILRETIMPFLEGVPENVVDILWVGGSEMINNVLDHSNARNLYIKLGINAANIWLRVIDDGVGVFEKISKECGLLDARHALLELSKGKLTTSPKNHSGEGVFFTSRMFTTFILDSRGLVFLRVMKDSNSWLFEDDKADELFEGTSIKMTINLNATHSSKDIYDKFENDEDPAGFSKTHVPVRLAKYPNEQLVSRSQAKRVLARFENFSEVMLDFEGVARIGQSFADEIFRVFAQRHPEVKIVPVSMEPEVKKMINHVLHGSGRNLLLDYQH
jgi:hypothetical protein